MAPRREEEMLFETEQPKASSISPASRPVLFELPKEISFLSLQQPSLPGASNSDPCDVIHERMSSSLKSLRARVYNFGNRIERDEFKSKSPVIYEACRRALASEMSRLLDQTKMLLDDALQQKGDACRTTSNKRVSVALINAIQYLDTLESAMTYSSRERLEARLHGILRSVANATGEDLENLDESMHVFVSNWMSPLLSFDVRAGSPSSKTVVQSTAEPNALPLELFAEPIMEFSVDDLLTGVMPSTNAFAAKILKCTHEKRAYKARDGVIGEAMVEVHVAPYGKKARHTAIWNGGHDAEKVEIKEVRAYQLNAYPPKCLLNLDIFTSTLFGDTAVTLNLALETYETTDGKAPRVQIELVM